MCMKTVDKKPISGVGYKTFKVRPDGKLTSVFYANSIIPGKWKTTRAKGKITVWSGLSLTPRGHYPKGFHVWLTRPKVVTKRGSQQLWLVEYRDVVASGTNQGIPAIGLLRAVVARSIRPLRRA